MHLTYELTMDYTDISSSMSWDFLNAHDISNIKKGLFVASLSYLL